MKDTPTRQDAIEKLGELIKDVRVAMLTTALPDGSLRSRPMATQDSEFDGTLWFFTKADSEKVHEIEDDQHINVSYAEPRSQTYVSVSGRARLNRDRAKIDELWNPMYKAWFPDGKDDPQITLLQVEVENAEYWDAPAGTLVNIVGFAKAVATGQEYTPGENEKVSL